MKLYRNVMVGSGNEVKLAGVVDAARRFVMFEGANIRGRVVASGVRPQPKGLEEIFRGAFNRAALAVVQPLGLEVGVTRSDLGVGIESGVFGIQDCQYDFGVLDVCACVLVEPGGQMVGVGLSSGFEVPPQVAHAIYTSAEELSDAFRRLGLSSSTALGRCNGAIGILTRDRVTRRQQVCQAALLAFSRLEQPGLYDTQQTDEEVGA